MFTQANDSHQTVQIVRRCDLKLPEEGSRFSFPECQPQQPPRSQLIPPFHFHAVENGVYRGAYPTSRNLSFLKRLKLKTIISLIPNSPSDSHREFCQKENITQIHFLVGKGKEEVTMTKKTVAHILVLLITPANLPLYIHCLDGRDVSGIVIMCLRKLQNWSLTSICSEFSRYAKGSITFASEFVERWNITSLSALEKFKLDVPFPTELAPFFVPVSFVENKKDKDKQNTDRAKMWTNFSLDKPVFSYSTDKTDSRLLSGNSLYNGKELEKIHQSPYLKALALEKSTRE